MVLQKTKRLFTIFSCLLCSTISLAQIIEIDSLPKITRADIVREREESPAFSVYRENYVITGIPLNQNINKNTADALIQISFRQRLTKSRLPFSTFAYLTYTQKSFWDVYAKSSPFHDNNYNPGIGLGRFITQGNRLTGVVLVQLKHESNGLADEDSRSWNYISLAGNFFMNKRLALSTELWIPINKRGNPDLNNYRGLCHVSGNLVTRNQRWWFTAYVNPRSGWGNFNIRMSAGFKLSSNSNQYLFAQYYNGYAEGLLNYNVYSHNLRIGACIKPDFFSVY